MVVSVCLLTLVTCCETLFGGLFALFLFGFDTSCYYSGLVVCFICFGLRFACVCFVVCYWVVTCAVVVSCLLSCGLAVLCCLVVVCDCLFA